MWRMAGRGRMTRADAKLMTGEGAERPHRAWGNSMRRKNWSRSMELVMLGGWAARRAA